MLSFCNIVNFIINKRKFLLHRNFFVGIMIISIYSLKIHLALCHSLGENPVRLQKKSMRIPIKL